jgi:uncharacterized membrane protein YccC
MPAYMAGFRIYPMAHPDGGIAPSVSRHPRRRGTVNQSCRQHLRAAIDELEVAQKNLGASTQPLRRLEEIAATAAELDAALTTAQKADEEVLGRSAGPVARERRLRTAPSADDHRARAPH